MSFEEVINMNEQCDRVYLGGSAVKEKACLCQQSGLRGELGRRT